MASFKSPTRLEFCEGKERWRNERIGGFCRGVSGDLFA